MMVFGEMPFKTVFAAIAWTLVSPLVILGKAEVPRERTARVVAAATLAYPEAGDLQFALSALWLNERTGEGNDRLRKWFQTGHRTDEPLQQLLAEPEPFPEELARALGGVKWSARTWLRIYYLFAEESAFFPGRLEADVQEKLEALCWAYGNSQSTLERADPRYVWAIQGSENHDMMDLSNAFLALQAIQEHPLYRQRELADGHPPREHVTAWASYYWLYARERASRGLFVEIGSPIYGKHFLGELFNMHDFAEDDALRERIGRLLDVTWADWAVDQLAGVRGGGKTRAYFGHYAERGTSDSWFTMGNFLFERPTEGQLNWAARHGQVEFMIATSGYQLPEVVADIALDEEGRGEFEYISRRPAKMLRPDEIRDTPPLREGTWYQMDPEDSRLVRYSYVTPDYVLGSLWIDPSLGTAFRVDPDLELTEEGNYAAISSQSQWQGIVFSTDPNARVFPQCEGEQARDRVNYQQHVAVQHENVLLVQKHRKAQSAGPMRVFFGPGMKERLLERDGWLYLQEGNAYLAVGILDQPGRLERPYRWEGKHWVYPKDEYTPLAFVAGRTARHENLEDFIDYVSTHQHSLAGGKITYSLPGSETETVTLALYQETEEKLPEVNGQPIELSPKQVYDSPFLSADYGSPRVTIRKGGRELIHDFSD